MLTPDVRFLLYHKQSTSARTLFLRLGSGSVLAPEPLPFLSVPTEAEDIGAGAMHPATLALNLATALAVPAEILQVEADYHERVETPAGVVAVYLVRLSTLDPPRELFAETGGTFRAITELRGGHPAEMALLRRAYEHVLGG